MDDLAQDMLDALVTLGRSAQREKKLAATYLSALEEARAEVQRLSSENIRLRRASASGRELDSLNEIDRSEKPARENWFMDIAEAEAKKVAMESAELAERQGIAARDPARDCSGG